VLQVVGIRAAQPVPADTSGGQTQASTVEGKRCKASDGTDRIKGRGKGGVRGRRRLAERGEPEGEEATEASHVMRMVEVMVPRDCDGCDGYQRIHGQAGPRGTKRDRQVRREQRREERLQSAYFVHFAV
jgi:hypothetical protein